MILEAKSALSFRASVAAQTSLCAAQTSAASPAWKSFVSTFTSSYWNTAGGEA